jgi:iron complex outermembrane receptor protein
VSKRARKTVKQAQIGLTANRPVGAGEATMMVYGGWRNLFNPLTFAVVDVGRTTAGASLRGSIPTTIFGVTNRLSAGADAQWQNDSRLNWTNCNAVATATATCPVVGTEKGSVRLDQRELISSLGPFVRDEIEIGRRYRLIAGARADYVKFQVGDRLTSATNPDDSGDRTLHAVSPVVGFVARVGLLHAFYANISSAFETPTTTELANKPDGSAGINPDLKPQYSTTYETGLKGFALGRFQYDVAAFVTPVRNELIQFQVPGGAGRTYFRNAGRTERRGAEASLGTLVGPLELGASYNYSHFRFTDYTVVTGSGATATTTTYTGKRIPGIPVQQAQANATWRGWHTFLTVEGVSSAQLFANDANTARAPQYQVMNLRLGGTALLGRPWLSPVIGVQNVFDRQYVSSVAVNATGASLAATRFYEPGAGRVLYAMLALGVGR